MAFLDDIKLWSFRGVPFAVKLQSTSEWDEWFQETTIMSIDPILDSTDRYVDIGGVTYSQVSLRAAFDTVGDRNAFAAMRGTTGLLVRPGSISRQALFTSLKQIASGTPDYALLDITFDAI